MKFPQPAANSSPQSAPALPQAPAPASASCEEPARGGREGKGGGGAGGGTGARAPAAARALPDCPPARARTPLPRAPAATGKGWEGRGGGRQAGRRAPRPAPPIAPPHRSPRPSGLSQHPTPPPPRPPGCYDAALPALRQHAATGRCRHRGGQSGRCGGR